MQSKKTLKRGFRGLFSAVGNGVFKLGGSVQRIPSSVRRSGPPSVEEKEASRRLQGIKQLVLLPQESPQKKLDKEWEEDRVEIKKHFFMSLSEIFFSIFKQPGQKLAKFFKGLDKDLYRANIRATPELYAAKMIGVSLIATVFAMLLMIFLNFNLVPLTFGGALVFCFLFFSLGPIPNAGQRQGASR